MFFALYSCIDIYIYSTETDMHTVHISYICIYKYHWSNRVQNGTKLSQWIHIHWISMDYGILNIRLPKAKNRQNLETAGEQSRCLQDGRNPRHQQCPQDPTIKD